MRVSTRATASSIILSFALGLKAGWIALAIDDVIAADRCNGSASRVSSSVHNADA
jgi:hypothetical protein